jgi:hypothetical protein
MRLRPVHPSVPRRQRLGLPQALYRMAAAPLLAAGLLFPSAYAAAQQNFEIQVYESETLDPGKTMVELHSNVTVKGTTTTTDGVLPTQHAVHETLEITHGFSPWFETAVYLFTSVQPGSGYEWVGNHIRPKVRVPESWDWPVGLALATEVGYQQRRFSPDTWTVELRPIIDKKVGPWYFSLNPAVGRSLKGQNSGQGFDFSPAAKIGYELTPKVAAGIEYYGALGPIRRFDRPKDQQQQIFPVVDLNLDPRWECNFGVGFGLTGSTDRLIVKMILGYAF